VVAAGVRTLAVAGVKQLVLTNAAGSLNADFPPGSWMMVVDHLNLTGATPLIGSRDFIDMTEAYSPALRTRFARAAAKNNVELKEGIYAGLFGPQYETSAEVRALRTLGADAVGMSTVIEVIQARALGMEVAAFSCLTNWAADMGTEELDHDRVLEVGQDSAGPFLRLLHAVYANGALV
jgi:purine-nucleoside phosphorylase